MATERPLYFVAVASPASSPAATEIPIVGLRAITHAQANEVSIMNTSARSVVRKI